MAKKKKIKKNYQVNNKSTRETFLKWLKECGNDLQYFSGLLSCCGSDGPKITEEKVGKAHFNMPEEIEDYLQEQRLYEEMYVIMGSTYYNPPIVHYLNWFKKNYE